MMMEPPASPLRAALYVRVSTDEQATEGLSLDAQARLLREYCAAQGYEEYGLYTDAGESARTDKRPAFQEMILAARRKPRPFDVILVHKTDRFARNRDDSTVYKALLRRECGIDVVSITERFEDSPVGRLMEGIMEVIAEFYSGNLALEVKKGMIERARSGRSLGLAPFGYTTDAEGHYVVEPQEADLLRWIFDRYAEGWSRSSLAAALAARDLSAYGPRAVKLGWSEQALRVMLRNRTYLGEYRWTPGPGTAAVVLTHNHPPIISPEQFDRVAARLADSHLHRSRWNPAGYLLKGFGRCAYCGHSLVYYRQTLRPNARGVRRQRDLLVCSNYYHRGCRPWNYVPMAEAEDQIWRTLQDVVRGSITLDPDQIRWQPSRDADRAVARADAALERVRSRFERQLVAFEAGILTLEELAAAKTRLRAEQTRLEEERAAAEAARRAPGAQAVQALRARLASLGTLDRAVLATPEAQRSVLDAVLDHFVYSRQEDLLTVTFRL